MAARDSSSSSRATPDPAGVLSRRQALTAAGALAAGSVASLPAAAGADGEPASGHVGIAPSPSNSVEFRAHFTQTGSTGETFAAFGYLTRLAGTADSEIYAGASLSEATALFTTFAQGTLSNRVHDGSAVHTLDIDGTLTVYQRSAPGATFADPNSFKVGTPVARFDVRLQDVLTVIMPGKGLPSLNGAMRQTASEKLVSAPASRHFGRTGSRARLWATGIGTLVDPVTLNSIHDMGGNWVVE